MIKPTETQAKVFFPVWLIWTLQGLLFSGLVLVVLGTSQITVGFFQEIAIIGALLSLSLWSAAGATLPD